MRLQAPFSNRDPLDLVERDFVARPIIKLRAPRRISPTGAKTGVRVRSPVDRSIFGLSSWLPDVATGFAGGGLIGSTHATQRVARRVTRPRPPSFRGRRSGACYKRGSSFRSCTARERCRWCARSRLPCRSFDHQIHELPPKRWTPLLSSFWSRKVFYGYGTSSIYG